MQFLARSFGRMGNRHNKHDGKPYEIGTVKWTKLAQTEYLHTFKSAFLQYIAVIELALSNIDWVLITDNLFNGIYLV